MSTDESPDSLTLLARIRKTVFGNPKDINDASIFHRLSLIPILAWIGLGADGLSSSCYGPEESFRALGAHHYLAIIVGLATAFTVTVISLAYARIIDKFPSGGGGYLVASRMLGKEAGIVSGCSLLVDYILTITVSIASCVDALFSFLPISYQHWKLLVGAFLIIFMIILNIRGIKESVAVLAPVFIVFIIAHAFMLIWGLAFHIPNLAAVSDEVTTGFKNDLSGVGILGVIAIFLRAYSLGGGTFTGIEAVSNGLPILREPRAQNGKKTMFYMATSLAFTALGLSLCYLLFKVQPAPGKTLNAVLADSIMGGLSYGPVLVFITIVSEGALLLVAAQAGFIDGPRVMSNMAIDAWLPRRFTNLSERLTMQNGVVLIGCLSLALLFYAHGSVALLVIMYAINVFITFSLSEFGMARYFFKERHREKKWGRSFFIQVLALVMCLAILCFTIAIKFKEGAWVTLVITLLLIATCHLIRGHYEKVQESIRKIDELLLNIPTPEHPNTDALDSKQTTAIQLVNGYNGFGVHTLLSLHRSFPQVYKNVIFVSVGVVDSGSFKGVDEITNLRASVKLSLERYVNLSRRLGIPADYRMTFGTDIVEAATNLCLATTKEFPKTTIFLGQLTFRLGKFYHRLLHNETAFAIQRRLLGNGIDTIIVPIKVDT